MKCIKCNEELEVDDNFCPTCGELTPHGYLSLKDNKLRYKENNIGSLFTLTSIIIISFITMTLISGKDMFRPYIELQKEISSLKYGYKVSIMNTNNKYTNIVVDTKEEAINLIKQDITKQSWKCKRNINVSLIEKEISENYNIPSVSLCDVDEDVSNKIKEVISATYQLFPNIKGYLTNITVTNAPSNEDYIAYFNPTNTFINNNLDIKEYNKVNKTEILLNSYYFLNKDILSKGLKENWYPNNASYESLIAHELGHYITFVTLLKQNNIDNITLVTKDNINSYQNILNILKKGTYSKELVEEALESYNKRYNSNISLEGFTKSISGYASQKVKENVNYDEVIAEAIHDYYLHRDSSSTSSLEIINIIKERLQQ